MVGSRNKDERSNDAQEDAGFRRFDNEKERATKKNMDEGRK